MVYNGSHKCHRPRLADCEPRHQGGAHVFREPIQMVYGIGSSLLSDVYDS